MSVQKYGTTVSKVATTTTASSTTTLTITSAEVQIFTGTLSQTVVLPVATNYTTAGAGFTIYNLSSGTVQVNYQDGTALVTMASGSSVNLKCLSNSTADGQWGVIYNSGATPPTSSSRTINAQTGTTYTFALTDGSNNGNNPLVTFGSSSATTVTVPSNSSVPFPVGAQIDCLQVGSGVVTFAAASGVTINSNGGLIIASQYTAASLIQISTNNWVLVGYLT